MSETRNLTQPWWWVPWRVLSVKRIWIFNHWWSLEEIQSSNWSCHRPSGHFIKDISFLLNCYIHAPSFVFCLLLKNLQATPAWNFLTFLNSLMLWTRKEKRRRKITPSKHFSDIQYKNNLDFLLLTNPSWNNFLINFLKDVWYPHNKIVNKTKSHSGYQNTVKRAR